MTTINKLAAVPADLEQLRPVAARVDGSGEFAGALHSAVSSAATTPLASPAIVNPVLLEELSTAIGSRRDRDARQRGKALLDGLAALRRAMLEGGDEQSELARLTDMLGAIPQADDPGLAALIRAIAVRATVELSRRGSA